MRNSGNDDAGKTGRGSCVGECGKLVNCQRGWVIDEAFHPIRACDTPMTAAWSKGRNARYGYYFCQTRVCSEFRKNIRKDEIEGEFEVLLRQMQPTSGLIGIAREMLKDLWEHKRTRLKDTAAGFHREILKLERKAANVMERLIDTDSQTLIIAYEAEIKRIEENKLLLSERADKSSQPLASFEETCRTACEFLANPWKLWASDNLEDRRILLRLAFAGRVPYCQTNGYRTAIPALPFKVLGDLHTAKSGMVGPVGLEPTTRPL